jgi:5-bromo-4-chloroindolyl phosphate hydrolysis protein
MKIALFFVLLLMMVSCSNSPVVYVCDSPNAKRYHYRSDCPGLSNCSYRVEKTTLEKAKKQGKTQCGWERNIKE